MRLRKHIILYTGERERETLFFINYRKYFLGLLCIENYSKSLTVQCNRPIRMVFAAHTFQYHLEYCERQMTNFKIKFGSIGKNIKSRHTYVTYCVIKSQNSSNISNGGGYVTFDDIDRSSKNDFNPQFGPNDAINMKRSCNSVSL